MTEPAELSLSDVRVVGGSATPEELAALIAVITESYSGEIATATVPEHVVVTQWARSSRALRQPLPRDLGWSGFRR